MTHLDIEISKLKETLIDMWALVLSQSYKSQQALEHADKDLAREVLANEKMVDAFELKINMDCESILALFTPLANDLRFVLAVMRINADLERIGDYARTICKTVKEQDNPFSEQTLSQTKVILMYSLASNMLQTCQNALDQEDMELIRTIFKMDDDIDKMNKNASKIIASLIKETPDDAENLLELFSIIRKIERMGDQVKSIAEEIVFYTEAKVIRHQKKKEKLI
jgi:phosphate transport system protein